MIQFFKNFLDLSTSQEEGSLLFTSGKWEVLKNISFPFYKLSLFSINKINLIDFKLKI
jgi:hypothetical protein